MEAFQTLMLKWRRSDQSFTPNELGLIKSQGKLIKIARDSKDNPTRVAAVRLLTDQKVLAEVALNEKDYRTRFAAVEQLADQSVLAEVAINDKESKIRYAAVKRITDQRALAEVVVNGQYDVLSKPVCGWAAGRIKDQDILIEMVKSEK